MQVIFMKKVFILLMVTVLFLGGCRPVSPVDSTIAAKYNNFLEFDFSDNWLSLKQNLEIDDENVRLEQFLMHFSETGAFSWYTISFAIKKENYEYYRLSYLPEKEAFTVQILNMDTMPQYNNLIEADDFFEALDNLNFTSWMPDYRSYQIYSDCIIGSIAIPDTFLLTQDGLVAVEENQLPINAVSLTAFNRYILIPRDI